MLNTYQERSRQSIHRLTHDVEIDRTVRDHLGDMGLGLRNAVKAQMKTQAGLARVLLSKGLCSEEEWWKLFSEALGEEVFNEQNPMELAS